MQMDVLVGITSSEGEARGLVLTFRYASPIDEYHSTRVTGPRPLITIYPASRYYYGGSIQSWLWPG